MRAVKHSLMVSVAKTLQKGRGLWIYPTQRALLTLLDEIHKVQIHIRQLNYHLADLEAAGYIKRIKRWGRLKDGTVYLRSSAYCLTIAGCRYLVRMGIVWAAAHAKRIKHKYPPGTARPACQSPRTPQDSLQGYVRIAPGELTRRLGPILGV